MRRAIGITGMVLAIIATIALIIGAIVVNMNPTDSNTDNNPPADSQQQEEAPAEGEEDNGPSPEEVINHYRVEFSKVKWFDDYNRVARVDPLTFKDEERYKATGLTFAPGFPLSGDTDEERLADIVDRDLREPITGASRIHAMVHDDTFRIFGVHVTEIFPQLKTFDDKYMEWMAMPSEEDALNGTEYLYTAPDKDTVWVSDDYFAVGKILAFIDTEVAVTRGVKAKMTSRDNYPLVKAATDDLRYCKANTAQEDGDVFLLEITDEKTGQVFYRYGFNVKDCRYEVFDLKTKGEEPKKEETKKDPPKDPPKKEDNKQDDPGGGTNPGGNTDPGGGTNPGGGGDPGGGTKPEDKPDGQGGKKKEDSSISQWDPDHQKPNDNQGAGTQNQDESKETKPVGKVEDAILPAGDGEPGFNSGAGPTGTTDTKSDVDPEDEGRESNFPAENVVNDTPATVDTTRGDNPEVISKDNATTDTGEDTHISTESDATDNWDGSGLGFE